MNRHSISLGIVLSLGVVLLTPSLSPALSKRDKAILAELTEKLAAQKEYTYTQVKRHSETQTIELEAFVAKDADFATTRAIMTQVPQYRKWGLKNINQRPAPDRGQFYIRVLDIKASPSQTKTKQNPRPSTRQKVAITFHVVLPLFNQRGDRYIHLETQSNAKQFTLLADTLPKPVSLIKKLKGHIKIFPATNHPHRIWLHVHGYATLQSKILFELLPLDLIKKEFTQRLKIILKNYLDEEDRVLEFEGTAHTSNAY